MKQVVVMFCGPLYGKPFHYGRIDHAVRVAKKRGCPLVICGDGSKGRELEEFEKRAKDAGIARVCTRYNRRANTRGDSISAAAMLQVFFPEATRVLLVTDWYHMARSIVQMYRRINRCKMHKINVFPSPVWEHLKGGLLRLPRELLGTIHALMGVPQPIKSNGIFQLLLRSRRIIRRMRLKKRLRH